MDRSGGGAGAVLGLALVVLVAGGLVILGVKVIGSPDDRARARASEIQAEAIALQIRAQAESQAAAERAATRQMERDAAHQRALELLPFVVVLAGGIVCMVLVIAALWDLRAVRQAASGDTAMLIYHLRRLELDQAERDRQLWQAIAQVDRRSLAVSTEEKGSMTRREWEA